jgi:hypothetical protein
MIDMDTLTPGEPLICEDVQPVNIRRLAAQVINQAIRDLLHKPQYVKKEVFLWMTSPEFRVWADMAGADQLNVYQLLPNLRRAEKLFRKER